MSGPLLERLVIGALDDHHLEADATDLQPPDRVAGVKCALVRARLCGDLHLHRGKVLPVCRLGVVRVDAAVVAAREVVLLNVRVERGERVLPLPHDDDPGEREHAAGDQQQAEYAAEEPHYVRRARAVSTSARTRLRTGPNCGRSSRPGYGA